MWEGDPFVALCGREKLHHVHFRGTFIEVAFEKYLIGGKYYQLTGFGAVRTNKAANG